LLLLVALDEEVGVAALVVLPASAERPLADFAGLVAFLDLGVGEGLRAREVEKNASS